MHPLNSLEKIIVQVKSYYIGGIFCAAMFSGTLLMIEGLFGGLDSDMKFIVNMISFTLLLSSLLCFIAHRTEFIKDDYKLQCINSGLEDSESRSSGSGGKDSGMEC